MDEEGHVESDSDEGEEDVMSRKFMTTPTVPCFRVLKSSRRKIFRRINPTGKARKKNASPPTMKLRLYYASLSPATIHQNVIIIRETNYLLPYIFFLQKS